MEDILNEILVQVKATRSEVAIINQRLSKLEKEFYDFKEEMYAFREEMYAFREEMYALREEFYKFREEFYKFKEEFYKFKEEVYLLFDKYNKEIGDEINQVANVIVDKINRKHKELLCIIQKYKNNSEKNEKLNEKDHKIYEAQINKLQTSQKFLESKVETITA